MKKCILSIVIVMLLFYSMAYSEEDPVETQYQKGITKKANDYPFSACRIFQDIIQKNPTHPRALDSTAQLILIDFDLSRMNQYHEESEKFLNQYPEHPLCPELAFKRIRAWNYMKNGENARKEIQAYSSRYPASAFNGDLPLLELESYIKDGTLSIRKQDADFQQLCDNLLEKCLSYSRLTRNASHYNMALSCGLKVCEETGRKEYFIEILEKEKTGIPRDMEWILMEKTRQAIGEIAPVTHKPQTPHELLNYPGKMDKMRQP